MIGKHLNHYEIVSELGRGGMGEVYRARDSKLGREVAIKVLPAEFSQDAERLARLEREARMLAALNHPNIAAIHGLEESDDTRFLVLELVEGDTLADLLERGPMPLEESLELTLQIADALEAAHEKGVIHRDLKPANIKVTPDGKVKVLDFGLAKAFEGDRGDVNLSNSPTLSMQATQQGVILGTASYMSPEQARGKAVDKRTDVWAYGCVLYELLTGRKAFDGEDVSVTLSKVLQRDPDLDLLPDETPARVRQALQLCLQKTPSQRVHDIADVRLALEGAFEGPTVGAATGTPVARRDWRWKLPWVAAIVIVAILAGAGGWVFRPATGELQVTRFPFFLPEGQGFGPSLTFVPLIGISPDGSRLVYSTGNQLHLRNLDEMASRPVSGASGVNNLDHPVFSPDGQWLIYAESPTPLSIKRIPVSGGASVTVTDGLPGVLDLRWDERDMVTFVGAEGIMQVSANGGEPELLVAQGEAETLASPEVLPGGEWVLFTMTTTTGADRWDNGQIMVQSLSSGERRTIWQGGSDARYISTGHLVYALGNTLFAIPFDLDRLEAAASPVPLVEGVRRTPSLQQSGAAQYAISDTGTLVYIPGTAGGTGPDGILARVDRSGGRRALDVGPGQYRSPRISPDGGALAVEVVANGGQSDIWIYDLSEESEIRRLTQDGTNTRPIWSPDGEQIAFGSDRDGSWDIYTRPADGSTVAERITMLERDTPLYTESWSSGDVLSFVDAAAPGNWRLWTLPIETGMPTMFDGGGTHDFGSLFFPDGTWLAYTSLVEVGLAFRTVVEPFPPTGVTYEVTQDNETWPLWSPEGDQLFYRRRVDIGEPLQLMAIDVSTEGRFSFRNPRTLPIDGFLSYQGYRDYDIMPDGQEFVMIFPADESVDSAVEPPGPQINVVVNWFQEVKERVPIP